MRTRGFTEWVNWRVRAVIELDFICLFSLFNQAAFQIFYMRFIQLITVGSDKHRHCPPWLFGIMVFNALADVIAFADIE